jgi:hypothetical protein
VGGAADPSGYAAWMVPANLQARIPEGCIAVCQNSAPSTYAQDIINIRSQLPTPPKCPNGTEVIAPFESRDNAVLNLKAPSNGKLEIIDLSGRTIFSKEFTGNNLSWDAWKAGGLKMRPGAYIARMLGDNQSFQKKLLINE